MHNARRSRRAQVAREMARTARTGDSARARYLLCLPVSTLGVDDCAAR